MWNPKYDLPYCVVCVIGQQLEWIDESGKTHKVNVQDLKVTYLVDTLVKHNMMKLLWIYHEI